MTSGIEAKARNVVSAIAIGGMTAFGANSEYTSAAPAQPAPEAPTASCFGYTEPDPNEPLNIIVNTAIRLHKEGTMREVFNSGSLSPVIETYRDEQNDAKALRYTHGPCQSPLPETLSASEAAPSLK